MSGNRELILNSPKSLSPQQNGSPLKRKTFRIAVRAATRAIDTDAISQAISYIELAMSVSSSPENLQELLDIVNVATANIKSNDIEIPPLTRSEAVLDFTQWDAGDDELLELREMLEDAVHGSAESAWK